MLTALNIEEYTRRGLRGMLSLLRHNRIRVEHLYCDAAAVKSVVYEHRRGKISWATIDRFVRSNRDCLLCPPELDLPSEDGYRRCCDPELNRRMCENAALYLLGEIGSAHTRVVLIDDSGERAGLCPYLVNETDSLRVMTCRPHLYLREADRILEERGAAIRISAGEADLREADLIIAPHALDRDIRCSDDAVILSGEAPLVRQNAPVVYEYIFDLPDKYRSIKPTYLDEMYFASALYSLCGVHELGSSVFRRCCDGRVLHTRISLLEVLRQRLAHREKSPSNLDIPPQ